MVALQISNRERSLPERLHSRGKGGAELWAENCVRCHNIRSPSNYSPAQWEVVMMHMRVRANLTPEEHKKILEFLKSGS